MSIIAKEERKIMIENTVYANIKIVTDEFHIPVAVQIDGEIRYQLYDIVQITGDCCGYICPGIEHEGIGRIVEITNHKTDHFFGVLMDNKEFGFVKFSRIEVLSRERELSQK